LVYFGLKVQPAGAFLCCGLEWLPLKNRSVAAQVFSGLLLTVVALIITACGQNLYKAPEYNFAGRPLPPSLLQERVMASFTSNGSSGGLEILDGLRDLRSNIQNTIPIYTISGYSGGNPATIINYPEQSTGYVFSNTDGRLTAISYAKETTAGDVATFSPTSPSVATATDGQRFASASESTGQLVITGGGGTYALNLPNVYKVAINGGDTVILAMVRNSNALYRVVKIDSTPNPVQPPGSIDCQPLLLPVYCVVPVPGTYDRPSDVYFSVDGNTAYVLNCGPECGGTTAGITFLQEGALTINVIPTVNPLAPGAPNPISPLPVANPIPIPGGVTAALSDGSTLYLAGQSQYDKNGAGVIVPTPRADGLFTGYLTTLNLSTYAVSNPVNISDGHHSKMLFADDNTLWIGSQQCASGERQALFTQQVKAGVPTTQAANFNCLTQVALGATLSANIVPAVSEGTSASTSTTVPFPNTNQNLAPTTDQTAYYYGSLTGLCWVQNFHKIFTAYGGQIHAFYTGGKITDQNDPAVGTTPAVGKELDNTNITIQGTVLDVAYIDALTNTAN
jgi:hypothetical protein